MVLSISYNPYLLESSFQVNGKSANKTPWAQYLRRRRLQTWFYPAPNWKGFAVEIQNALNEREVEIEFTGRKIDYQDLQLFCDQWNSQSGKDHKTRFVLKEQKCQLREDKNVLQELDKLVATFKDSPVEELRSEELQQRYQQERKNDFDMAVVATMSSGKSTLMYLLDRLYPVTDGTITIGGQDINDIPPATIRSNIGFVLQEGYLYTGTIADNISVAGDDISQEEVEHAAEAACVDDNIRGFAQGYETVVGERGVTLSGGQKQRVSIARTLVRKTPILVFDDSLSAVDSDTDAAIRARLAKEFGGATVILISHRITTVMHADNIIVMEGGTIAEQGTSHELLQQNGIYRQIYDMQMSLPDELKKEVGYGE